MRRKSYPSARVKYSALRSYVESVGLARMRTTLSFGGVLYEVLLGDVVMHSEFVHFSFKKGHLPSGRAFQQAARRQDARAHDLSRGVTI